MLLPGYCLGELAAVETAAGVPVERGPRDLRRLPDFFGQPHRPPAYGAYDIQILAEINHAPRLALSEILSQAAALRADGADVIDVGCDPGETWGDVGQVVGALVDQGHRVSIDSMNVREVEAAVLAGAKLVLSVNSGNRQAARDWGCEVVVVPDVPATLGGLEETVEFLAESKIPLRIDPVLEPIGFGFAASLGRYLEVPPPLSRRRNDDGHRQPHGADRRRFGPDQRAAVGLLPGAGHPQRVDDAGDQLGPHVGQGVRPGPAAGVSRRAPSPCCPSGSSRGW